MSWIWIALLPPILWSVSNHIDKYLYNRYYRDSLPGSLMLLTAAMSAGIVAIIALFGAADLTLPVHSILLLLLAGVLNFGYVFPYIYALMRDEASRVAPLFQITPIFSYLLAWAFLHEHLTASQVIAGAIITIGALSINLDLDNRFRLKKDVFGLMTLSAGLFAVEGLVFKAGAADVGFWTGAFYQYSGLAITGLIVALVSSKFRRNFMQVFRANKQIILTVSLANEVFVFGAFMLFNYATLRAPLAMVALVSNTQPFWVIAFGILITIFLPNRTYAKPLA